MNPKEAHNPDLPTIVLVDDNDDTLFIMSEVLGDQANLTVYRSAQALVAAAERHSLPAFDLLLLDYDMPGMDGIEACQRIHSRYPDGGLIVFYSALYDKGRQAAARDAGADGYCAKQGDSMLAQARAFLDLARHREFPADAPRWLTVFKAYREAA